MRMRLGARNERAEANGAERQVASGRRFKGGQSRLTWSGRGGGVTSEPVGDVSTCSKKKQVKNLFLNLELGLFDCLILILQDFCWIIVDLIRFYSTVSVWLVAFSFHARVPKRSVMAQSKAADADAVTTCDWFFYFFLLRCVSRQLGIWIGMSRTRCITAVALVGRSHVMTHLVAWCDVFSYQMLCCVVRSWGLNTWMVRYLLLASAGFNRLLVIVFLVSIDCGGGVGSSFQSDPFG